jgi:Flp pilus assembly protein TadD
VTADRSAARDVARQPGQPRRAVLQRGSPVRAGDDRTAVLAISLALVAVVVVLYAQTGQFEFVSMDDLEFITDNPSVNRGLTADGFAWSLTAMVPNWHPVTWWSHMLDVELFGLSAGGHHLTSTALHAANSVVFFLAFRLMTGATWPSALAAALFAVHPLRAESVAWLSERKDLVSGFFWMLALLAYGWYVRRPDALRYLLVAVSLTLGMMGKTMVVSLPIVLLLLDVWPLARLRRATTGDGRGETGATPSLTLPRDQKWSRGRGAFQLTVPSSRLPSPVSRLILEKVPLLAISIAGSVLSVQTQQTVSGAKSLDDVPLMWRLVNAPLSYVSYLRKSVWPSDLAGLYPHPAMVGVAPDGFVVPSLLAVALLAAVSIACLVALPRRPYLAVGWFWYLIALVPVIGLVQTGMQSMADRYTYLSMPGLYVALAWAARDLVAARPTLRTPVIAAAALALVALAVVSWFQIGTWRTSRTLYEHGLAVTEGNYFMHASLGAVLRGQGDAAGAERHLREALRLRPTEAFTHMQLGTLLEEVGRLDEAAEAHQAALRLNPGYARAHGNLGVVRLRQERLTEAEAHLRTAVRIDPTYAIAYRNLGAVLIKQNRFGEAVPVLQQAVQLDPASPDAHNNLGVALVQVGRLQEAGAQFELALRLKPGHANATRGLAYVREQLGR